MPTHGVAGALVRTALLMMLVVVLIVALRSELPLESERRRQESGSSAAALVPFVAAIVAAVLTLLAALKSRGTANPVVADGAGTSDQQQNAVRWRTVAWMAFAMALVLGVFSLIAARDIDFPLVQEDSGSQPDPGSPSSVPAHPGPPQADPTQNPGADAFDSWPVLLGVLLVLLTLLAAGAVVRRPRERGDLPGREVDESALAGPEHVSGALARAAELGLATVAEAHRGPRAAIIACYVAMERGLAAAPGAAPQESDTPSEVLARAVEHGVLRSEAAAGLVSLFTEARFSPHEMTEHHRESAASMLRLVLADLREVTCESPD